MTYFVTTFDLQYDSYSKTVTVISIIFSAFVSVILLLKVLIILPDPVSKRVLRPERVNGRSLGRFYVVGMGAVGRPITYKLYTSDNSA